uniref:Uncharacterized protein n=1 Tax=viral metagenome TaxID=1070528 RepID=A0A6C0AE68_9ZZZZ
MEPFGSRKPKGSFGISKNKEPHWWNCSGVHCALFFTYKIIYDSFPDSKKKKEHFYLGQRSKFLS